MNGEEILEATRELIDELKPHDFSDRSLLGYASREQSEQAAIVSAKQSAVFERYVDVDFSTGTDIGQARLIEFPENLIAPSALEDVRTLDSPLPVEQVWVHDRWKAGVLSWFTYGQKIGLAPKGEIPSGAVFRIWGQFLPPRLIVGAVGQAEILGSSALLLPPGTHWVSLQDDYYNGSRIEITSGASAGARRRVKDYVGSTRTITLESGWPAALTTDDRFALEPSLPEPHHEILAFGGALRASFREANVEVLRMIRQKYDLMAVRLQASTGISKSSRPRVVRDLGW